MKNCPLELVLHGFVFNYRGSEHLLTSLLPIISSSLDSLSVSEQALVVKAYYILEIEADQLSKQIEINILDKLKDVAALSVQEIYEVLL